MYTVIHTTTTLELQNWDWNATNSPRTRPNMFSSHLFKLQQHTPNLQTVILLSVWQYSSFFVLKYHSSDIRLSQHRNCKYLKLKLDEHHFFDHSLRALNYRYRHTDCQPIVWLCADNQYEYGSDTDSAELNQSDNGWYLAEAMVWPKPQYIPIVSITECLSHSYLTIIAALQNPNTLPKETKL